MNGAWKRTRPCSVSSAERGSCAVHGRSGARSTAPPTFEGSSRPRSRGRLSVQHKGIDVTQFAAQRAGDGVGWTMTTEAMTLLIDEIARLREDLAMLTGQGLEEGVVRLPVANAARRLGTLTQVLETADIARDDGCVAIGRRATLRDEQGGSISCAIVFPGDGDPANGWISADSPLGSAILGARPGETVRVEAPAGTWRATVLSVD